MFGGAECRLGARSRGGERHMALYGGSHTAAAASSLCDARPLACIVSRPGISSESHCRSLCEAGAIGSLPMRADEMQMWTDWQRLAMQICDYYTMYGHFRIIQKGVRHISFSHTYAHTQKQPITYCCSTTNTSLSK